MEGNRLTLSLSRIDKKTGMMPEITPEIRARVGSTAWATCARKPRCTSGSAGSPPTSASPTSWIRRSTSAGVRLDVPLIRAMRVSWTLPASP
jgi:hypothetical protein